MNRAIAGLKQCGRIVEHFLKRFSAAVFGWGSSHTMTAGTRRQVVDMDIEYWDSAPGMVNIGN